MATFLHLHTSIENTFGVGMLDDQNTRARRIVILGGDGFCGWPMALYLSRRGCEVTIIDNQSRRAIDRDLGTASLTAISSLEQRLSAWSDMTGRVIRSHNIDIANDYDALREAMVSANPDAIVHFGEQRSAPYSMRSSSASRYTVSNNISATHNVLAVLVETGLDAHLVHLGSVGVYGYSDAGLMLPEGYLSITAHGADGRDVRKEVLYPGDPVSIYHMTKAQDQLMFAFYAEKYGVRITDLHQGIVWGTQTAETALDPHLVNRFDYDPIYGTVVNRFLVQAAVGHPLTVYGTGEQTRAYIHIRDTIRCIELAIETPPKRGERVRVINQIAETMSVGGLARLVASITGAEVAYIENPRNEPASNEFEVDRTTLNELGQVPRTFESSLSEEADLVAAADTSVLDLSQLTPEPRQKESVSAD